MNPEESIFKEKLESAHQFPGKYTFKFIVTSDKQSMVEQLVKDGEIKVKPSSGNKYVSVTIDAIMPSSDAVIDVYKHAKKIDGLIAL